MLNRVDIDEKFSLFADCWHPRIVADLNDHLVKVVRVKGEFVWHRHEDADELFLVHRGAMTVKFRDRDVHLTAGQLLVVPKGVEHLPVAAEEAQVLVIEPGTVINTGELRTERTKTELERI